MVLRLMLNVQETAYRGPEGSDGNELTTIVPLDGFSIDDLGP